MIYILGHSPHEFGIIPDKNGFVGIKELLQAMHEDPDMPHASEGGINEVLMSDERDLFEKVDKKIRAVSRHWVLDTSLLATRYPSNTFYPCEKKGPLSCIREGANKERGPFLLPDTE